MIAYFDCFSGISGDMTLGALVDLGLPVEWLKERLRRMPLANFNVTAGETHRHGIHAKLIQVEALDESTSRNFSQIRDLIENCPFSDSVKSTSLQIFQKLAEAEAHIHSCSMEEVHFHEVGGVDAIVDIVGTALGIEYLAVKKIFASNIPLGKGFVTCSHGKLPVPAPATLGILKNIPVYGTTVSQELVTPTGAAIIATLAQEFGSIPGMVLEKIGYGAGQRDSAERPNLLRIMLGHTPQAQSERSPQLQEDQIEIIESSIDDMNPELFGHLMQRLFDDGALAEGLVKKHPQVVSVMNNITSRKAGVAIGEIEHVLAGSDKISDKIGDFEIDISANSFFQTNSRGAEVLFNTVKEYVGLSGTETVLDLYSGTGTIPILLSGFCNSVTGIEIVESAVADAENNCRINGVSNCSFIQGDIRQCLPRIGQKPDLLIIDPPRAGMHKDVVKQVLQMGVERIVYVSCNPATMARDIGMMQELYRLVEVQPVDMFPHTYHIEAVSKLVKL